MFAVDVLGPMELALKASLPVLCAPLTSPMVPLATPGRRLLLAADGIYIEARSPALYVRVRIAEAALPFGSTRQAIEVAHGLVPSHFLRHLCNAALAATPNEMAALITTTTEGGYRVIEPQQEVGPGHVKYDDATVEESTLVIDAHSHGTGNAYFSAIDDASDKSRIGPHISLVFGCCYNDSMEVKARVCVGAYLVPISKLDVLKLFESP